MAYLKGYIVNPDAFTGTCSTAAATAAKVITVQNTFELKAGAIISVKFTNTNTANNPTFNVNSKGAKSVWYNTALITNSNKNKAGYANRYSTYIYDGTQWVWIGGGMENDIATAAQIRAAINAVR